MKQILALPLICTVLFVCGTAKSPVSGDGTTFTDSMDRIENISDPQQVGICVGSLAE